MTDQKIASVPPLPGSNIVSIAKLADHVGEEVTLQGWLYNKRSSGKLHFLEVRDGSGIVQAVVFKGDVSPELFAAADHLQQEASLTVVGTVKEHGKIKGQYEIQVKDVTLLAAPSREYPISPRSTAPTSSWTTATSGCGPSANTRSCGCATPSSRRSVTSST